MKEQLYKTLKIFLEEREDVLAAFEGGSKATGFNDSFSDLDLEIICKDDAVEDIFIAFKTFLNEHYGILRSYRMAEPTWHGFSQEFYLINQMPAHFYIDLSVIKETKKERLTDHKRHGHHVVWFDKGSYITEEDDSEEVTFNRCKKVYQQATAIDFLMMIETEKNLDRGKYLEAYQNFYRFILSQLVVMLNLKNRPEKVDFGYRYAYRDYIKDDFELLTRLMQNHGIEELKAHYEEAKNYYLVLKEKFKKDFS